MRSFSFVNNLQEIKALSKYNMYKLSGLLTLQIRSHPGIYIVVIMKPKVRDLAMPWEARRSLCSANNHRRKPFGAVCIGVNDICKAYFLRFHVAGLVLAGPTLWRHPSVKPRIVQIRDISRIIRA